MTAMEMEPVRLMSRLSDPESITHQPIHPTNESFVCIHPSFHAPPSHPTTQQPQAADEEQPLLELADVELTYGGRANAEGTGTLLISSRRVSWEAAGGQGAGRVEVEVPSVTLHAISKDPSSFPKPCLYCQVSIVHVDGTWVEGRGGVVCLWKASYLYRSGPERASDNRTDPTKTTGHGGK